MLTFNTWLLEFANIKLADHVVERRDLIADEIEKSGADVINLIEVRQLKNASYLIEKLKKTYPYCSFNPDKIRPGSFYSNGLLVLSKWPLKNSGFRYKEGCIRPLQELVYAETTRFDERLVSKGAIHNVLIHPDLGAIDLFSSHLGALSFAEKSNDYPEDQKQKVFQQSAGLSSFIKQYSETPSQILMIDTNRHFRKWNAFIGESHELDPTYSLFLESGFDDSFMTANHLNPRFTDNVYTFDQKRNPNAGDGHFSASPSEFIDYIFVRSKLLKAEVSSMLFTQAKKSSAGTDVFLSDHFAVTTTFSINRDAVILPLALRP